MDNKEFVIEEAFNKLNEINSKLESSDVSLKDSLEYYSEGVLLVKQCKEALEGMEKEIIILSEQ